MQTKEQIQARVNHRDWPECLQDLFALWRPYIELGEYDEWELRIEDLISGQISTEKMERMTQIDQRIHEMDNRFIRTFFPEIADAENNC